MMQDTAIIINPSAHDWLAEQRWFELALLLEKYGISYERVDTRPEAGTVPLVKETVEKGFGRIVAVGGDGTINEVLNGIMAARVDRRPRLALVPFGTANDIAKSFKIAVGDLEECVRAMVEGLDYPLDLGLVDGRRYFADAFTIGFDARVLEHRNLTRGHRLIMRKGIGSYIPSLAKEILFHKKVFGDIIIDGERIQGKLYNLIVKNSRVYAGSFVLNKRIRGNDGKLDVFLFRKGMEYWSEVGTQITKQVSQATDPSGISGDIMDMVIKNYEDFQARSIEIRLSDEMAAQIDGEEYEGSDRFLITCEKAALTLQVPFPY
jgi:diacylglycerol kinase (ATP)